MIRNILTEQAIKKSKGFSLIELMVVITLIVILATIGTSYYFGIQKKARDSARISEISQLAKALEVTKSPTSVKGSYQYSQSEFSKDFTSKPHDPLGITSYCIATNSRTTPLPNGWTNQGCPESGGFFPLVKSNGTLNEDINTTSGWILCALLENQTVYCQTNGR